ncbi:MAG: DUF3108 domain-containing protein [Steroidobacteraceae bacterium]
MNVAPRMTGWQRWFGIGLLLACSSPLVAAATSELRPFRASYNIAWNGLSAGSSDLELQRLADGRWSYQSRTFANLWARIKAPAELSSRSVFAIQNGHVVPQQLTSDDGAGSSNDGQQLNFDWTRSRVTGVFERKPVDLPTQPGLLDSQSVVVALMNELLAGRTPQKFVLVEKGLIREYAYTKEGTATLRTAVGTHQVEIYRSSRSGSRKTTWFWCAPELGYLPLKVERREGKTVELQMRVKSIDISGTAH